jgi:hypothetical protein
MNEIAARTSWKNLPIDNPKRIKILLHFNNDQFLKLRRGLEDLAKRLYNFKKRNISKVF